MKKHSFKKSGTNLYKNGAGGGSKAIYKLYKKTDVLEKDVVPKFFEETYEETQISVGLWHLSSLADPLRTPIKA